MKCAGCSRDFQNGDLYIEDTPSGFMHSEGDGANDEIDGLIAGIFGGTGNIIRYCEACTVSGGGHTLKVYSDDDAPDYANGEVGDYA